MFLLVSFIPMTFLLYFSKDILLLFGQDPVSINYAYQVVLIMIPGCFCMAQTDLMSKFCSSMQLPYIPLVAQVTGTIMHIMFCFFFVNYLQLEIKGIAYATTLTYFIELVIITIYAHTTENLKAVLVKPNEDAFK